MTRKKKNGFSQLPSEVFHSEEFDSLSKNARHLLFELTNKFDGYNNGDLSAALNCMTEVGWSKDDRGRLWDATCELVATGFIEQTQQGGRNKPNLYALTWLPISECKGKPGIRPTQFASNLWRPENHEKRDSVFVRRWLKHQAKNKSLHVRVVSAHYTYV